MEMIRKYKNLFLIGIWIGVLIVFPVLLIGCGDERGYHEIDFANTIDVGQSNTGDSGNEVLEIAVSAMISPEETLSIYRLFLEYIGARTGMDVKLVQRKTYTDINNLFLKGEVDLGFICTGPYAAGKEKFGFEAVATPIIRGEPFYQAYLIVHRNSSVVTFEDLRGKVFAFTDPESNTGYAVPVMWLRESGENPETFFKRVHYTFSHDNSIMATAKGLVDGASVDGHIWEYFSAKEPVYTSMTKIIKKSRKFGSPPLVVSSRLDENVKKQIVEIILDMHFDPEGKDILDALMIDRFEPAKEEWYVSAVEVQEYLESRRNE